MNIAYASSAQDFISHNTDSIIVSATISDTSEISISGLTFGSFSSEMYTGTSAQLNSSAYSVEFDVTRTGELLLTATNDILTITATKDIEIFLNPTPLRITSANKEIDLVSLLPSHLEFSETANFLQFFEDFLNEMYYEWTDQRGNNSLSNTNSDGTKSYYRISADSDGNAITSAGTVTLSGGYVVNTKEFSATYNVNESPMISILEKTRRLTDLHDPDLIDIEYIQQLANYMGYNIAIHRNDITDIENTSNDYELQRYLRNVISQLPSWYRIKSTKNAIKVLLYSFGVVGEFIQKWADDNLAIASNHPTSGGYGNDTSLWTNFSDGSPSNDLSAMPDNYFSTPHFEVRIDLNSTPAGWFYNINKISSSIEEIRPIQAVLEDIRVRILSNLDTLYARIDHYDVIKNIFESNTEYPDIP